MNERIVIVGGGHAGGRVGQILASTDGLFEITIVGREPYPPYERPRLSKGVLLGTASLEDCLIWKADDAAWSRIRSIRGVCATAINPRERLVDLDDGSELPYDKLVIATGSRIRKLAVPGGEAVGIHSLRSYDDATGLATDLRPGRKLLIVGGGFVGLEIAAAAYQRGIEVTVVEASDRILSRIAPPQIGEALSACHRQRGVSFRLGCMVEEFISTSSGNLKAALLSSGETIRCDLAVVGVGVSADTQLANTAGLAVDAGIRTNASLETSAAGIYACGDCASFFHTLYRRHIRVEAWWNAEDHARVVAGRLLGRNAICDTVPYFWSDQYELSLQVVGLPHLGSAVTTKVHGSATIQYHFDARDRLVGATGLGTPSQVGREIRKARQAIARDLSRAGEQTDPVPTAHST